jgi:peroxiredoxin
MTPPRTPGRSQRRAVGDLPRRPLSAAAQQRGAETRVLARLRGAAIPELTLHSASFGSVEMREMTRNAAIVYFYTGTRASVGDALLAGSLEESYPQLLVRGFHLIGVHAQEPQEQLHHMACCPVDHILVADPQMRLARSLGVPSGVEAGQRVYQRTILVVERAHVIHALYPALEPGRCASELLAWLEHQRPHLALSR